MRFDDNRTTDSDSREEYIVYSDYSGSTQTAHTALKPCKACGDSTLGWLCPSCTQRAEELIEEDDEYQRLSEELDDALDELSGEIEFEDIEGDERDEILGSDRVQSIFEELFERKVELLKQEVIGDE